MVVSSALDRPWSQYFCCMAVANREFARNYPVATKRALRAILKATDICALEPERAARSVSASGVAKHYDYALQTMRDVPYGLWREYDPEDTLRFYALRLHEVGMIKSTPADDHRRRHGLELLLRPEGDAERIEGLQSRPPLASSEVTGERFDGQADLIFLEEIRLAGLYDAIWQAFAVLLPVRTVGVMGDARTYENVCALRAVTSVDGMTADFFHFDMEFLGRVANRIVNEVRGINRVVYDVTSKPPGTIEWE